MRRDDAQSASDAHALHRLLGHDLDVYVNDHMSTYEDAKKKWTDCTMEEWTAGADGNAFTLAYSTMS